MATMTVVTTATKTELLVVRIPAQQINLHVPMGNAFPKSGVVIQTTIVWTVQTRRTAQRPCARIVNSSEYSSHCGYSSSQRKTLRSTRYILFF